MIGRFCLALACFPVALLRAQSVPSPALRDSLAVADPAGIRLAKWNGRWVIVNVLWELHQRRSP